MSSSFFEVHSNFQKSPFTLTVLKITKAQNDNFTKAILLYFSPHFCFFNFLRRLFSLFVSIKSERETITYVRCFCSKRFLSIFLQIIVFSHSPFGFFSSSVFSIKEFSHMLHSILETKIFFAHVSRVHWLPVHLNDQKGSVMPWQFE